MSNKNTAQFDKLMKETSDFGTQYSEACTKSSAILMNGGHYGYCYVFGKRRS